MSSLLFVLIMEYLTRILLFQSTKNGMGFHPGCKAIGLNSLCFADDLIMLCKANIHAFSCLLEGLSVFF